MKTCWQRVSFACSPQNKHSLCREASPLRFALAACIATLVAIFVIGGVAPLYAQCLQRYFGGDEHCRPLYNCSCDGRWFYGDVRRSDFSQYGRCIQLGMSCLLATFLMGIALFLIAYVAYRGWHTIRREARAALYPEYEACQDLGAAPAENT